MIKTLTAVFFFGNIFLIAWMILHALSSVYGKAVKAQHKINIKKFLAILADKLILLIMKFEFMKKYQLRIQPMLSRLNNDKINFNVLLSAQVLSSFILALFFSLLFGTNIFLIIIYLITGFSIPVLWITSKISYKNRLIFKSLPDMLDLLTMCMQAGLDFSAALNKYLEKGQNGPLYTEFATAQSEIQMGKSRVDALQSVIARTCHPELSQVVNSIVQALKLGTSLSPILKSLSGQLRVKRFQIAEKLAHEAPTKMLFPLILFIFPTVFIILFGPIILSFMKG